MFEEQEREQRKPKDEDRAPRSPGARPRPRSWRRPRTLPSSRPAAVVATPVRRSGRGCVRGATRVPRSLRRAVPSRCSADCATGASAARNAATVPLEPCRPRGPGRYGANRCSSDGRRNQRSSPRSRVAPDQPTTTITSTTVFIVRRTPGPRRATASADQPTASTPRPLRARRRRRAVPTGWHTPVVRCRPTRRPRPCPAAR